MNRKKACFKNSGHLKSIFFLLYLQQNHKQSFVNYFSFKKALELNSVTLESLSNNPQRRINLLTCGKAGLSCFYFPVI